jgi:hypothetical protein
MDAHTLKEVFSAIAAAFSIPTAVLSLIVAWHKAFPPTSKGGVEKWNLLQLRTFYT